MSLPDADAIQASCRELGLEASPEQAAALLRFVALLQQWNAVYNLTAVREAGAMWTHHVLDCVAALPSVQRNLALLQQPRILDVGSGGGLPGVVWAVLMPHARIVCVDAVGKKAAFIRQVAGSLSLAGLTARHARVENLADEPFDLITSRAFSSLADFERLTRRLLKPAGAWVAMKGKVQTDELATLDPAVTVFHVEPLQVPGLNAERCLVWLHPASQSTT